MKAAIRKFRIEILISFALTFIIWIYFRVTSVSLDVNETILVLGTLFFAALIIRVVINIIKK